MKTNGLRETAQQEQQREKDKRRKLKEEVERLKAENERLQEKNEKLESENLIEARTSLAKEEKRLSKTRGQIEEIATALEGEIGELRETIRQETLSTAEKKSEEAVETVVQMHQATTKKIEATTDGFVESLQQMLSELKTQKADMKKDVRTQTERAEEMLDDFKKERAEEAQQTEELKGVRAQIQKEANRLEEFREEDLEAFQEAIGRLEIATMTEVLQAVREERSKMVSEAKDLMENVLEETDNQIMARLKSVNNQIGERIDQQKKATKTFAKWVKQRVGQVKEMNRHVERKEEAVAKLIKETRQVKMRYAMINGLTVLVAVIVGIGVLATLGVL